MGEVIMRSSPVVNGPRMLHPSPICVGCHKLHQDPQQLSQCPQCHLPVCGLSCSQSSLHQNECSLISTPIISTSAVTPLRVIKMKYSAPDTYKRILQLGDNLEILQDKDQWPHFEKEVIEPINDLGIEGLALLEIQKIVGIILTNTFETTSPGSSLLSSSTVGMYLEPSMMNHHCVANTRVVLDSHNNMKVIAALPIKRGSDVYNNYVRGKTQYCSPIGWR